MSWEVKYNEDLKLIETSFSGILKKEDLFKAIEATLAEASERNANRFLSDCSKLEGGHSLLDLYEKANEIFSSGLSKDLKEAIILPALELQMDKVEFWKTVSNNMGFNVKVFHKKDEALKWLLS